MRIHPRYYPIIILATFTLFVLLGLLLGFQPRHRGGGYHRFITDEIRFAQAALEILG